MNGLPIHASSFEDVVEHYLTAQRQGLRPTMDEYVARYPQYAEQIRDVFPTLEALEQFGPEGLETSAGRGARKAGTEPLPERLGDFAIVRELGRGGMGVVYEAIQESLGRRVALKILAQHLAENPRFIQRFRREAQSAGRLHHTNIVPVYAVGEHDGVYYYAMQYIAGHGLDVVIEELRRQQTTPSEKSTAGSDPLLTSIARRALGWEGEQSAEGSSGTGSSPVPDAAEVAGERPSSREGVPPAEATSAVSQGVGLPGSASHEVSRAAADTFFTNAARIGLQAAEALDYAHRQGVVHRDVKPSNLMIDPHGDVWLTDFGLAKESEAGALTATGDILGTLRYIAPEQLDGRAGAASDLYSMGATLYELVTLRPPFEDAARGALLEMIRTRDPRPPRQIDARVPRDLETIILKTLEKEPAGRYRSADELAEDLRAFLSDRPILARRSTPLERAWRWCRRNRSLAAALAALVLLVGVAVPIGLAIHAYRLADEVRRVKAAQAGERAAREVAQQKLAQAYLEQAAATRLSNAVGRRQESLELVASAAGLTRQLALDPAERRQQQLRLRNEALAALTSIDLRRLQAMPERPPATGYQVSESLESYHISESTRDGTFAVRRVADQSLIQRLGGADNASPMLSPDGRWVAVWRISQTGREIWRVGEDRPRFTVPCEAFVVSFSRDGRWLAVVQEGKAAVYELDSGQRRAWLEIGAHTYALALYRNGKYAEARRELERKHADRQGRTAHEWYLEALLQLAAGTRGAAEQALRRGDDWRQSGVKISTSDERFLPELRQEIAAALAAGD